MAMRRLQQQPQPGDEKTHHQEDSTSWPSHIRQTTILDGTNNTTTQRLGHLLGLLGYSQIKQGQQRVLRVDKLYQSVATFLAWKHFNERNASVLPQLAERWSECDFYWTYEARDTALEPMQAIRELVQATATTASYYPFAIAGPTYSKTAKQVSVLGAALEIPQMSGTTTSSALDASLDTSPLFSRTVPASNADAQALIRYFESLPSNDITHLGCVYINDSWGAPFQADLLRQANANNLTLISAPYIVPDGNHKDYNPQEDIRAAMETMARYDLRYYILLVYSRDWKTVVRAAFQQGFMGQPGYFWTIADSTRFLGDEFFVDRETEGDLAFALNGLGILNRGLEPHAPLEAAMREFSTNPALQEEFYSKLAQPQLFANLSHFQEIVQTGYPGWDLYFAANYDAAVALGLAACKTPGLFTGPQLDASLRQLKFHGTSGEVRFHPITGTRVASTAQFWMMNLVLSEERSTSTQLRFDHFRAATIRANPHDPNRMVVVPDQPYRYTDNTTRPPRALPPIQLELNWISSTAQIVGWVLASCTIALAIFFLVLTLAYRKRPVIRAAQPIFLAQLCVGIIVMVASVYPMSYQSKTTRGGTWACMATPWLFCLGFAIAISALLAKAWRLSKLVASGRGMRRITVQPKDVVLPSVVLVVLNVGLLTAWTVVAPLAYERVWVETNIDVFGRQVESYGVCRSSSSAFAITLAVLNFLPVLVALYQCYTARSLPTQFSESKFLTIAIASIFETLCIGAPFLFLVSGRHPSAHYSVQSSLVCIIGSTLLLVLFLPKFGKINEKRGQTGRAQTAMLSQAPMDASMHSMHSAMVSTGSSHKQRSGDSNRGLIWGSSRKKSARRGQSTLHSGSSQVTRSSSQKRNDSSAKELNDSEINAELCELAKYGDVSLPPGMMMIYRTDG